MKTMTKSEKLRAEEQLDLNPQPADPSIGYAVGERLRNNRCPRCDGDLSRITDHDGDRRYCHSCRMTVMDAK